MYRALFLGAVLTLAVPAAAQTGSYYVDFGDAYLSPSNTYGAADGTGGTWNVVTLPVIAPHVETGLLDAAGNASGVSLTIDTALGPLTGVINFDSPTTFGDDQALLDEGWWVGGLGTMTIDGLPAGTYRVYTYAMAPDAANLITSVNVPGSPDPLQDVGGDFSAGFVLGVTHAEHSITIAAGGSIVIETDVVYQYDSICGVQIVPEGGAIGTNFCISVPNSTGSPATISGTGSASIAANDLVIRADNLPAQPGIFIAGPSQAQLPFFDGFLCVAPNGLQRFLNTTAPSGGVISEAIDYASSAAGGLNVVAGSSYNYQRWNRDPAAGGSGANFSDGLEVLHTP